MPISTINYDKTNFIVILGYSMIGKKLQPIVIFKRNMIPKSCLNKNSIKILTDKIWKRRPVNLFSTEHHCFYLTAFLYIWIKISKNVPRKITAQWLLWSLVVLLNFCNCLTLRTLRTKSRNIGKTECAKACIHVHKQEEVCYGSQKAEILLSGSLREIDIDFKID